MKFRLFSLVFIFLCIFAFSSCNSNTNEQPKNNYIQISVVNGTGNKVYQIGETATISADVPEGKVFKEWTIDGVSVSAENPYSFTATKSETYTAVFKNVDYNLVVHGGTGSGTYEGGTSVTIKANDEGGQLFSQWVTANGTTFSTNKEVTFKLLKNMELTAEYRSLDAYADYIKNVEKKSGQDFKILCLTDIQLHDGESTDITFKVIDDLVTTKQPDLIIFLGDLLNDNADYDCKINYQLVINKIDSYNIPWAPIFGNHDNENYNSPSSIKSTTRADLINSFNACNNCLFTLGPSYVSGKSNYIINVLDEDTKEIVESLYLMDSCLSGFDETHVTFYKEAVEYNKYLNKGVVTPSLIFCHIAINQYGNAYDNSQACEYKDIIGTINRNPCDLASGTKNLFPLIKSLGSTTAVICGHDHENSYYTYYEGIKLAYAMKSSEGDNHTNYARIGGALVSVDGTKDEIEYCPVDIPFEITKDQTICLETLPNWANSGAKLEFDIELPTTGKIRFAIFGTNTNLSNLSKKEQLGAWNRLTCYEYIDAANVSATYGSLTLIEGNKYHYVLDLSQIDFNKNGSEGACGTETARVIYFNDTTASFTLSNMHYQFSEE